MLPPEELRPGEALLDAAKELDKHYIPARYPNSHPQGAPFEYYTRGEAEGAISRAGRIIGFCQGLLAGPAGDLPLWGHEEDEMEPRKTFIELVLRRARPGSGSAPVFREQRTWSLPVSDLRKVIRHTPFVVIGGVATRLYMPERMTLDVDILVAGRDADALYQELRKAGCRYEGPLSAGGSHWTLADGSGLDVIESDAVWVSTALTTARQAPDGLPIIDLPYLVLMKLEASRTQDLADVSRMLGGAADCELDDVRRVVNAYLADAVEDLESLIALGRMEEEGRN